MKKRILNIGLAAVLVLLSSASMYAQGRDYNNHNGNYNNTNYDRRDQVNQNFTRGGDRDRNEYRGGDRDDHRFDRRDDRGWHNEYRRDYDYHQRYWVAPHYEMRGCYRVWIDGYWAY
jgi:hypothetical protein